MAEYFQNPQDLDDDDDGELLKFLPSDIFLLDQQITPSNLNQPNYSYHNYINKYYSVDQQQQQHLSCMGTEDRLSQSFSAFSFSGLSPPPHSFLIPPRNLGRFRPPVQCVCCSGSLPVRCFAFNGCVCGSNLVLGYENEAFLADNMPLYPYYFMNSNPFLAQSDCFIEERVGYLLDRQRQTMANRLVDNRFFPFSGSVGGGNGVGYVRDYGGTGVFLPRIQANISSAYSADPMDDHPRRRQGARNRHGEEAQFLPPRNSFMNMVHMKKQEDYLSQVSPEMGLPEDWTY